MYADLLTFASLCAVVIAGPGQLAARQDVSAIEASLAAIQSSLLPNPSLASELTGVPSNVQAAATNPALIPAIESQFASGQPAWFTSLPADAKSYILNAGAAFASASPLIASLEAQLTAVLPTATGIANSTVTAITTVASVGNTTASSSGGNSTVSTKNLSTTTGTVVTTKASTSRKPSSTASTEASSSSSSGGAAQATGAIALGLAGVVGFAGMVIAL